MKIIQLVGDIFNKFSAIKTHTGQRNVQSNNFTNLILFFFQIITNIVA